MDAHKGELTTSNAVQWTSEQSRLLRVVTQNARDHCSWRELIRCVVDARQVYATMPHAEFDALIQKIHLVFDFYFNEYPPSFLDWVDYVGSLLNVKVKGDVILDVYLRAIETSKHSVDIWLKYCQTLLDFCTDHAHISSELERAVGYVGSFYDSGKLWDVYLKHETEHQPLTSVAQVYKKLLCNSIKGIDEYFVKFKELIANKELYEFFSAEEFDIFTNNSAYIDANEKVYQKSVAYLSKIIPFEEEIIVYSSGTKTLDQKGVDSWLAYLEFAENDGDEEKAIQLYERASTQLHSYPDFWKSYVEYLESLGRTDHALEVLNHATEVALKMNVQMHLFCAKYKMRNYDLFGARGTYVLIYSVLSPNDPEAIEDHAFMELTLCKDTEYSNSIFKNAIILEKKKGKSKVLPHLLIRHAHFSHSVGISVEFEDLISELQNQVPLSKLIIEGVVSLLTYPEVRTTSRIEALDTLVNNFIRPELAHGHLADKNEKSEVSAFWLEFLEYHGDTDSIKKAASRHMSIFSHNTAHFEEKEQTRKRKTFHSSDFQNDDDMICQSLDEFLSQNVLTTDSEFHFDGEVKTKLLPIGRYLLLAILKAMLRRHRKLRSFGGDLNSKCIFIMHDRSKTPALVCRIAKVAACDLTIKYFAMDWCSVKEMIMPKLKPTLPVFIEDFFGILINRIPINFLSHLESRELYFFRISCHPVLPSHDAKQKLISNLYKCYRDGFFGAWGQFDSIFDDRDGFFGAWGQFDSIFDDQVRIHASKISSLDDSVFKAVSSHGTTDPSNCGPSRLIATYRHYDAHGTERAKELGMLLQTFEEFADRADCKAGQLLLDISWDLCASIHRHTLLADACIRFSSNAVESPLDNPLLKRAMPQPVTTGRCLTAPCPQSDKDGSCVLWLGDLPWSADEVYLYRTFVYTGEEIKSVKVRRNRVTGLPEGDAFVEFASYTIASKMLTTWRNKLLPRSKRLHKISLANFSCSDTCFYSQPGICLHVNRNNLLMTDYTLQEEFRSKFASFRGAMVAKDRYTGLSLGYGFVKLALDVDVIVATQDIGIKRAEPSITMLDPSRAMGGGNDGHGYPPGGQGGYPPQHGYPPQQHGYPPQQHGYSNRLDLNLWVGSYDPQDQPCSYGCETGHSTYLQKARAGSQVPGMEQRRRLVNQSAFTRHQNDGDQAALEQGAEALQAAALELSDNGRAEGGEDVMMLEAGNALEDNADAVTEDKD